MIERDLFGTIRLVRNWGRIGTNGRELVEEFPTEIEAGQALEAIARAKRRPGARICKNWLRQRQAYFQRGEAIMPGTKVRAPVATTGY